MSKDPATPGELLQALDLLARQASHITKSGREAFCSDEVEAQVARSASCQLVIQLQAIVEDLPEAVLSELDHLPLREVRGMRNRLAHGYGDIDAGLLWTTMHVAMPEFIAGVRAALDEQALDE